MSGTASDSVDELLQELTPEAPCGVNLEYDAAFLELEQAILGKPEVQFGDTVTPEIPPDWKKVRILALDLIARSRDLRVALPLARAWLKLQGISGFAAGLLLIHQLLAQRWDSVHPQLDPDDGFDPMMRLNALAGLCEASTVLRDVRETCLVASKAYGRYSLRDIDFATGETEAPEGVEKVALAVIDAAFHEVDPEQLEKSLDALELAYTSTCGIEKLLTEKVGAAQALDLSGLSKMLKRARDFVRDRSMPLVSASAPEPSPGEAVVTSAASGVSRALTGEISSRDDVVRMLDKICTYYARQEPSSPIPLLLQRAQRLVDKSFLDILQDLAPDGLNQMYQISGTPSES